MHLGTNFRKIAGLPAAQPCFFKVKECVFLHTVAILQVTASSLFGGKKIAISHHVYCMYKGTKTMSIRPQELLKQTKTKPAWHFAELTHTDSPIIIHHELGYSIILYFAGGALMMSVILIHVEHSCSSTPAKIF